MTGYFKEVDILVNTPHCVGDHGAGVGNNILEAGLYDTPVVTYNMAGISEMVDYRPNRLLHSFRR